LAEEKLSSSGILIAFATNPGNVALDGKGRNSPFTKAIIDNIRRPGVEISTLMTDVRVQVVRETDGQQTPWINSALLGRFYFNPDEDSAEQVASADVSAETSETGSEIKAERPKTGSSAGVDNARIAAIAWDSVKDSNSVEELETFMQVYGSSFYGKLAQIRIDRLKSTQGQNETAAAPGAQPAIGQDGAPVSQGETQVASLEQPDAEKSRKLETNLDPRELAKGIQSELARLNCNPGRPDGIWGRRSQSALDKFVKASKVELASASPAPELLDQLQNYDGTGCPKAVVRKKTCPAGQRLSRKGNCYTPKTKTASAPAQTQTRSISQQQAQPQQEVFIQNGQQVIIQQPQQVPQGQVIVQQPQQQPVIVQQPQPVQQRPSIIRNVIRGVVGGVTGCLLGAC
ncbi:MAG: caspase family protein, partial [Rhizobiaceae bacterium]